MLEMSRVINTNDLDPELVSHLEKNMNNHIWRDKNGFETKVYDLTHSQRVAIYNDLITGRTNVLFLDEWIHIFLNSLTFVV